MAKIRVKNRFSGRAVYNIPEFGDKRDITRSFAPGEIKEIDEEEIEALTFVPGGKVMLEEYLQILDDDLSTKLIYDKQPEYDLSEEDIKNLMINGSLDAFLDCLDFAPTGVLEIIKDYAVSLPLNDNAKRDAIRQKLNFDVDRALLIKRQEQEDENNAEATDNGAPKVRRTARKTAATSTKPARRVSAE